MSFFGRYFGGDIGSTAESTADTQIVRASVQLDGPEVLRSTVFAGTPLYFTASFRDNHQQLVAPVGLTWALMDADMNTTITSGTIDTPREVTQIVVDGVKNVVHSRRTEARALVVTATYGNSVSIKAQEDFRVKRTA